MGKRESAKVRKWAAILLSLFPTFTLSAQQPFDIQQYSFTITLPDVGTEIHASALVQFRRIFPTPPPGVTPAPRADTLRLDLVGMHVDSVAVGPLRNSRAPWRKTAFTYDDATLSIPLAPVRPPARGYIANTEQVRVFYHGSPSDGLIYQETAGQRTWFGDNWPNRARHWLPVVDDPADKARVAWTVHAPRGLAVVTNQTGPHAIPAYCMVIGAARMTVSRHRPADGRIPIEVWAFPSDSAFADSVPFRRATEIVEAMEQLVGPFDYPRLAHVESSTRYGGMENSSAIFYDQRAWGAHVEDEGTVRHETAHQWFGDAVTEREWHHVWLSEGFATFFDAAVAQQLDGDSAYRRILSGRRSEYMRSHWVGRPIIDSTIGKLDSLLNANSYEKGALVLAELRRQIGDTAFFKGLRGYYLAYRDSTALSINLERAMEIYAHQNLDWFFRQWLYQPGYPQLQVSWAPDSARRRTLLLHVRQGQPAAWGLFRLGKVPVALLDSAGAVVARDTIDIAAAAEQDVRLAAPALPAAIRIDPDGVLLLSAAVTRRP